MLDEFTSFITIIISTCSFCGVIIYAILKGKFVTLSHCRENQNDCRNITCQKIKSLEALVDQMHVESEAKRDSARKENSEQFEKIYNLIRENEIKRFDDISAIKLFMGEIKAEIKALKDRFNV